MRITVPMPITHSRLISCSIGEDPDATPYDAGTTYAEGDQTYKDAAGEHKVYRSVQNANTGHNPSTDDGTWWVVVGWTNRWKCLKTDTGQPTVVNNAVGVTYEFNVVQPCTEIALRALKTQRVNVRVYDAGATLIHHETKQGIETIDGVDWYVGDMIFTDLPIGEDCTVEVYIMSGVDYGPSQVGQIILGYTHVIGEVTEGTVVGFQDFSIKSQDEFGNFQITERGVADTIEFEFVHDTDKTWLVKQILLMSRATPCLFWDGEELIDSGIFIFGYADEPVTDLDVTKSYTQLDVIGIAYTPGGVAE